MTYSISPSSNDDPLVHTDLTERAKEQTQTSFQLALDIFSSQDEKRVSISQISYGRNIKFTSLSGMSLDQRRLFDVLFYLASQDIESESLIYKDYVQKSRNGLYTVDLSFLKGLLYLKDPYNDNLQKLLSNLQKVKFEIQILNLDRIGSIEWISVSVFPTFSLSDAKQNMTFQINSILEEFLENTQLEFLAPRSAPTSLKRSTK